MAVGVTKKDLEEYRQVKQDELEALQNQKLIKVKELDEEHEKKLRLLESEFKASEDKLTTEITILKSLIERSSAITEEEEALV